MNYFVFSLHKLSKKKNSSLKKKKKAQDFVKVHPVGDSILNLPSFSGALYNMMC